ncbi:MAG: hypothetical protein ACRYHQ_24275 [Janthinobacterium lividum]
MMEREFSCEGCGQNIIDLAGTPALTDLPDLCGGCFLLGPKNYVRMATATEWLDTREIEHAEATLKAFIERWGEEMADKGITDERRIASVRLRRASEIAVIRPPEKDTP